MNARDRKIVNELHKTHLAMVEKAGEDPIYVLDSILNPHSNITLYWTTLHGLKVELKAASDKQWLNIQKSRAWGKTWKYLRALTVCRFALAKLELAGVARYFKFVGLVDGAEQYRCVRNYVDGKDALIFG